MSVTKSSQNTEVYITYRLERQLLNQVLFRHQTE